MHVGPGNTLINRWLCMTIATIHSIAMCTAMGGMCGVIRARATTIVIKHMHGQPIYTSEPTPTTKPIIQHNTCRRCGCTRIHIHLHIHTHTHICTHMSAANTPCMTHVCSRQNLFAITTCVFVAACVPHAMVAIVEP